MSPRTEPAIRQSSDTVRVERVKLDAVRFIDDTGNTRILVPLRDPINGSWWTFGDGFTTEGDGDAIRAYLAAPTVSKYEGPASLAAYRALSDLIDELQGVTR